MTPSHSRMAPFSAYIALVRGVLVDFGLGSLIDKFEQHFGKRVAVALLALVGLAIVAGALQLIAGGIIKPVIDLYNNANWPGFKTWLIERLAPVLISLGILFFLAHLGSSVGSELYRRTFGLNKLRKKTDEHIDRALEEYQAAVTQRLNQISSEAEGQAVAKMDAMKTRLMNELRQAMETRDAAMDVAKTIQELVGEWLSELDETKPEESVERSREFVQALKGLRSKVPLTDKGEPTA